MHCEEERVVLNLARVSGPALGALSPEESHASPSPPPASTTLGCDTEIENGLHVSNPVAAASSATACLPASRKRPGSCCETASCSPPKPTSSCATSHSEGGRPLRSVAERTRSGRDVPRRRVLR